MAPPASNRISARIQCVQEHVSPVHIFTGESCSRRGCHLQLHFPPHSQIQTPAPCPLARDGHHRSTGPAPRAAKARPPLSFYPERSALVHTQPATPSVRAGAQRPYPWRPTGGAHKCFRVNCALEHVSAQQKSWYWLAVPFYRCRRCQPVLGSLLA